MSKFITRVNPKSMPNSEEFGYSQISIVEPGRMAYVSGQVAWRAGGEPVPSGLVEQTRIAAANARAALDALGATPNDIAILRCFMTNMNPETLELIFPPLLQLFEGCHAVHHRRRRCGAGRPGAEG